jgi:ATP adenylyltransferase
MDSWFTPWRYSYLVSPREKGECLLCRIRDADDDRQNFVVCRARDSYVVINRYPYNNGHLMIVPNRHCSHLGDLNEAIRSEMMELASSCERALRVTYNPEGLNLGLNVGKSGGAGIAGHLHLHILPRWSGDTNFMTVVGETRIIPEELAKTYERLAPLLGEKWRTEREP